MAESGITVDTKGFARQVDRLAKKVGLTAKQVMFDQMRLWMNSLVKLFPPKSSTVGRKAIDRDMRKLFFPMDTAQALSLFAKAYQNEFPGAVRLMFNPSGDQSRMEGLHRKYRRNGKVRYRARLLGKIGDGAVYNKMHVTKRAFNAHKKKHTDKVGQLKAGWIPGMLAFAGRAPQWVMKQSVRMGSTSGRGTMNDSGDGFFEATNAVPYAGRYERHVRFSGRVRQLDLNRQLEKGITRKINVENQRAA